VEQDSLYRNIKIQPKPVSGAEKADIKEIKFYELAGPGGAMAAVVLGSDCTSSSRMADAGTTLTAKVDLPRKKKWSMRKKKNLAGYLN